MKNNKILQIQKDNSHFDLGNISFSLFLHIKPTQCDCFMF